MILKTQPLRIPSPSGGGSSSTQIPYFMQRQTQSNWCWAACGASVGNYFHGPNVYTQCGIANTCQGKTTCCSNPSGCNQYGYLNRALSAANSYDSMKSGTDSFSDLKTKIDSYLPVGARVAWFSRGAHFMMIAGYNESGKTQKITIQDPIFGSTTMAYSSYPASYHGGGTWTHTYYTKR